MHRTSSLKFIVAGLLVSTSPASADSPWTGAYVGANIGAALAESEFRSVGDDPTAFFAPSFFDAVVASGNGDFSETLMSGGVQLGFNVQQGNWVFGLEADLSALQLDEQQNYSGVVAAFPAVPWTGRDSVSADWLATARARAGMLASPALLIYGTAGVAFTQIEQVSSVISPGSSIDHRLSGEESKVGWVVGGGAEYALGGSWRLKAEYLFISFDGVSETATLDTLPPPPVTVTHSVEDLTLHNFRLGLNYGF